jgi:hypothetical protein
VKALSIRQPWAWAIVHSTKRIENRDWNTSYRGPLLIHAAKGCTRAEYGFVATIMVSYCGVTPPPLDDLQRGGIIGKAWLTDVVTKSADVWFEGKFGFVLEDVEPLPFRPLRGMLGLFEVPFPQPEETSP